MKQIIPTAEPFFFRGSDTGVVLVHGFTGAPKEMRWMGEYLAARGYTVLGVRLAGHATRPTDMLHCRWQDWLLSVEDSVSMLRCGCQRVYLAGLSMGGILSLLGASFLPVHGVVAMSTPYALADPRLKYIRILRYLKPSVDKGPPDWRNPEAAKDHVDYPEYPTKAIAELVELLAEMRAALPRVKVPALLAQSRQDGGVLPENMERIYAALGSPRKQMLWLENSGHVITREPERQRLFEAVDNFIKETVM